MNPFFKFAVLILLLLSGLLSDQLSKHWALQNLKNKPVVTVVENILELSYTENHGMVFGINNNKDNGTSKSILLIIRICLSIGLTIYIIFHRKKDILFHLPFVFVLSGAFGNVIDSLRFQHVIDFIHMHIGTVLDWPFLYNLADAYVCIGMALLIIQSFLNEKKHKATRTVPENASA